MPHCKACASLSLLPHSAEPASAGDRSVRPRRAIIRKRKCAGCCLRAIAPSHRVASPVVPRPPKRTMLPHPRRLRRRLARILRPVVLAAVVLAQCTGAFGYPVVLRGGETIRQCGCRVKGPSATCCCGAQTSCGGVVGQAIPEPEVPACPKCKVKKAKAAPAPRSTVTWLPSMSSRSCQGDGPQGLIAESPAIPPQVPGRSIMRPLPGDTVPIHDDQTGSHTSIPPDPPPRRG